MKPKLFIASSRERLDLARSAQEELEHDVEATVWSQGVFELSRSAMASLMDVLDESDFGLFIFAPDDVAAIRSEKRSTVRDNVVYELGLFAGRLGIERCFMVVPSGVEDLHLPTDLAGLTAAFFDPDRQDGNMVAALGPACNRIRRAIQRQGPVQPPSPPESIRDQKPDAELIDDPNDCIALIASWMGRRPSTDNTAAMRYDEVDRILGLAPGSARLHLEKAANRWGYIPAIKGKDTILFQDGSY